MSSDGDSILYPTIGFGVGLYLFCKGFREFRKYRVMADTPVVPIRSMAMGRVEIYGTAQGEQKVRSPVSHTPCYWYKVEIEKRTKDSKGRESWSHHATDQNGVNFYLQDATAKVLANASSAELDLLQSCRTEMYGSEYIASAGAGTAVPQLVAARPPEAAASAPGTGSARVFTPGEARQEMESLRRQMRLQRRQAAQPQQNWGAKALGFLRRHSSSGDTGRYRLTEWVIVPGHPYHISGTCAENPNPRDEDDRNIIRKGENEPTFHISWRTEQEVEKYLHRRSLKFIFGGGALAVVCLGILVNNFGWL
jgi:hypothetical protein